MPASHRSHVRTQKPNPHGKPAIGNPYAGQSSRDQYAGLQKQNQQMREREGATSQLTRFVEEWGQDPQLLQALQTNDSKKLFVWLQERGLRRWFRTLLADEMVFQKMYGKTPSPRRTGSTDTTRLRQDIEGQLNDPTLLTYLGILLPSLRSFALEHDTQALQRGLQQITLFAQKDTQLASTLQAPIAVQKKDSTLPNDQPQAAAVEQTPPVASTTTTTQEPVVTPSVSYAPDTKVIIPQPGREPSEQSQPADVPTIDAARQQAATKPPVNQASPPFETTHTLASPTTTTTTIIHQALHERLRIPVSKEEKRDAQQETQQDNENTPDIVLNHAATMWQAHPNYETMPVAQLHLLAQRWPLAIRDHPMLKMPQVTEFDIHQAILHEKLDPKALEYWKASKALQKKVTENKADYTVSPHTLQKDISEDQPDHRELTSTTDTLAKAEYVIEDREAKQQLAATPTPAVSIAKSSEQTAIPTSPEPSTSQSRPITVAGTVSQPEETTLQTHETNKTSSLENYDESIVTSPRGEERAERSTSVSSPPTSIPSTLASVTEEHPTTSKEPPTAGSAIKEITYETPNTDAATALNAVIPTLPASSELSPHLSSPHSTISKVGGFNRGSFNISSSQKEVETPVDTQVSTKKVTPEERRQKAKKEVQKLLRLTKRERQFSWIEREAMIDEVVREMNAKDAPQEPQATNENKPVEENALSFTAPLTSSSKAHKQLNELRQQAKAAETSTVTSLAQMIAASSPNISLGRTALYTPSNSSEANSNQETSRVSSSSPMQSSGSFGTSLFNRFTPALARDETDEQSAEEQEEDDYSERKDSAPYVSDVRPAPPSSYPSDSPSEYPAYGPGEDGSGSGNSISPRSENNGGGMPGLGLLRNGVNLLSKTGGGWGYIIGIIIVMIIVFLMVLQHGGFTPSGTVEGSPTQNVQLIKSVDKSQISSGEKLHYTIKVIVGDKAEQEIKVTDPITFPIKDNGQPTAISDGGTYDTTSKQITWDLKDPSIVNANSEHELSFDVVPDPSLDNKEIYNLATAEVTDEAGSGGSNTPPNQSNCNGKYALTNPSYNTTAEAPPNTPNPLGNFGDPNCNFTRDAFENALLAAAADSATAYRFMRIAQKESHYQDTNPNDGTFTAGANTWAPYSTSNCGAFGLFQMNPDQSGVNPLTHASCTPSGNPNDVGSVDWPQQITNALNAQKWDADHSIDIWGLWGDECANGTGSTDPC